MEFTDHLNRTIFLPKPPERIISLVPSQTELLVDLGLEEKIVGITKFCVHPHDLKKRKTIVGGTKNYRFEVIEALKPDLIIGNKEENDREGIERLASIYPVWMSDIYKLDDSLRMISDVGILTGTSSKAEQLVREIQNSFSEKISFKGNCVYLIWENPLLAAGKNTFIDSMLRKAGFENLIQSARYPALSEDQLISLSPDFLLLSSEPFPFKEKHIAFFQNLLPKTKLILADGELFSWYGSRLLQSSRYFKRL
ncbi:cobalamin-binding protein [Algoriphagus lacus]|uniref:Cobalamin-binding protein n=1 Tax=Algoriphagus lacus TaxID=2056311 RepID=A0A418PXA7_9BACT|nr:helical backbone metal receptor [Algoriphagus lacus]RIW18874.1 cobalamin-binding protein [Algoriphagus lacus]